MTTNETVGPRLGLGDLVGTYGPKQAERQRGRAGQPSGAAERGSGRSPRRPTAPAAWPAAQRKWLPGGRAASSLTHRDGSVTAP